ncbi:hypothetical protein [Roseateles aquatilis]|nr:hypothetical protein [Roseateles aquatilis]
MLDQESPSASGQSQTYFQDRSRDARGQRVTMAGVTLLMPEAEIQKRTTVQDLAAFVKTAEASASRVLELNPSAMSARVQFECRVARCGIKLATKGDVEKTVRQALQDALVKLPPLKTSGEVHFQVEFRVAAR